MKNLFYLIIVTVLFVSGIAAQSRVEVKNQNEMTRSNLSVNRLYLTGIQSAEGLDESFNDVRSGNTFVLSGGDESVSVHLTISMNYTSATPDLVMGNKIVGGTWTLIVYKNDVYFGTLYGDVSGGEISWKTDGRDNFISRQTDVKFAIAGGLDGYEYREEESVISENILSITTNLSRRGPKSEALLELPL